MQSLEHAERPVQFVCPCGGRVFSRAGHDLPLRRGFCQSPLTQTAASSEAALTEASSRPAEDDHLPKKPPVRHRLFVAEIVCLLCGRSTGTALAEHWPPTGPILFQPPDAETPAVVRAWWRLRCAICGGNTAAGEVTTRTVRLEPAHDWRGEKPRRGRPPKWLAELRQARASDQA
jgi:hypothetical protein